VLTTWRADRAKRKARAAFRNLLGELVARLGAADWERSPEGLQRLAEELPAAAGAPTVDSAAAAVELVAAQSPRLTELSDAGGEVAGWELEERFGQARTALTAAFGEPVEKAVLAAPVGPRSTPARTATWTLPACTVTLQERCDDRHRLALRISPVAAPAAARA
jgi:hypothetical protein